VSASETPLRFAGYAAIFDKRDSGGDVIRQGAFARSLTQRAERGERLPLYWQHRPDRRIGWIDAAIEDERGLRVTGTIDATAGLPAQALATRAVNGLSFGYRVTAGHATPGGRELHAVDILEVSLVSRPMQPSARVHLAG
jgi:HK97 family phage prohead protease